MSSKIVLLIDAENISHRNFPEILEKIPPLGELVLRAVYGNWDNPTLHKWRKIAEDNHLEIMPQSNPSKTKNSADIDLITDALKILLNPSVSSAVDVFCLVSNDADYVRLCDKIHEAKKSVIGVGNLHASEAFIRACDTFIFIGRGDITAQPSIESLIATPIEVSTAAPQPPPPPTPQLITQPPQFNELALLKLLLEAFAKTPKDSDRWVILPELGTVLRQIEPGFQSNNYGHAKLSKLLQSMPDFVELQGKGADISARLKK